MTALTGTIKRPDGTTLTGTIKITLSHPAHDVAGGIVNPITKTITVTNGALVGSPTVLGNDVLEPANTYYWVEYFNSKGTKVMVNPFYITGASYDLGSARPTTITTSNISYADPVIKSEMASIAEHADNAAAVAAGLVAGDLYRTGDALKVVHS